VGDTVTISTHVLDAVTGKPAVGVGVRLELRTVDGWTESASARTDGDGRIRDLPAPANAGPARLIFDTAGYLGEETFYPEVVITFSVRDLGQHLHVPLLLSPYAYSTYRGS
jgi:5-hydroxyisourate hydrolase